MEKKIAALLLGLVLLCASSGLKAWSDANLDGGSDPWGTGGKGSKTSI